jgi:hypothetical protein
MTMLRWSRERVAYLEGRTEDHTGAVSEIGIQLASVVAIVAAFFGR